MTTDSFISLSNLQHKFPNAKSEAIFDLTCSFESSQMIGLIGPDGAGKTTLLRILAGLLKPSSGNVLINGINFENNKNIPDYLIRYMPQRFGLYEDLTVIENLNLYSDLNSLSKKEKEDQLKKLLHFTNLEKFQKRLAKDLSGGMKQKLGLACSLLKRPKLLLLDEPTVGVDPVSRLELWDMIHHLMEEKMTIICSTSYLDEVSYFQKVLILNEGKLLYSGSPSDLIKNQNHRSFFIENLKYPKRETLTNLLINPTVLDGIIHGDSLRILSKPKEEENCKNILNEFGDVISAPANFEDAFLDLIPQNIHKKSPIYSLYPTFEKTDLPIIEANNLKKNFHAFQAVNGISFSVNQGEIFGLLGPNGAGKSTTFKMICGLMNPSSGEAKIKNISLLDAPHLARSKIGYMAQKFSLYSNMTVEQNLKFFYGIYPKYNSKNNIIEEMTSIFYLTPFLKTLTSDIPLGFKQRLALACSIMHRPEVLFLDEPTSGVDPITRREFWNHINALVSKNVAIIVTTHFMDEAEYCDRIGLVNQGKLIAIGTPDELKNLAKNENNKNPTLQDAFIYLTKAVGTI